MFALIAAGLMFFCVAETAMAGGRSESASQEFGNFTSVQISTPNVRVEVVKAQNGARLEAKFDNRRDLTISEQGGEIVIELSRFRGLSTTSEYLKLFVPGGKRLSVDSGSGAIEIEGLDFVALVASNGSGSVNVSNCNGEMVINSGSGKIEVANSDGEKTIRNGSGAITVRSSDGDVAASNGSATILLDNVAGALNISNGSGRITGESITLSGNSRFGNGSGRININFTNTEDELSFDLETETGSLRVGDVRRTEQMVYGTGATRITGRGGSGAQVYKFR
jgi:DUF4097 and DUF4098 domain-containing protein YvlB